MAQELSDASSYSAYTRLYERYIAFLFDACSGAERVGGGVSELGSVLRSVAPPVWLGCGQGVCAGVSGTECNSSRATSYGLVCAAPLSESFGLRHDASTGDGLVSGSRSGVGLEVLGTDVKEFKSASFEVENAFTSGGEVDGVGCGAAEGYEAVVVERPGTSNDVFGGARQHDSKHVSRGVNYERNRANRLAKKAKKARQKFDDCSSANVPSGDGGKYQGSLKCEKGGDSDGATVSVQSAFVLCDVATRRELAESYAQRLIVENKQAAQRAKNLVEIEKAVDVDSEIRKRRAQVNAATEKSLVSIEKTHAILTATGNVPGDMTGFAATILESKSISPDSSASGHEFRQCQKALLDSEAKNVQFKKMLEDAGIEIPCGPRTQRSNDHARDIWTDNDENIELLNDKYPGGYGMQPLSDYGLPGKMRVVGLPDEDYYQ